MFNAMAVLRCLALLVLAWWVDGLADSGMVAALVHPRFFPAVSLAAGALFFLALFQCRRFTKPEKLNAWSIAGLLLILSPVLISAVLPVGYLGAQTIEKRGLTVAPAGEYGGAEAERFSRNDAEGVIEIREENFAAALKEITHDNPARHLGKRVVISGMVHRDKGMRDNQFAVTRLLLICCAADAVPVGLICESEDGCPVAEGAWVRVEGTLEEGVYMQRPLTILKVTAVDAIEPPPQPYVYPPGAYRPE